MKIKANSWHYQLLLARYYGDDHKLEKECSNLCPYFWHVVFALIIRMGSLLGKAISYPFLFIALLPGFLVKFIFRLRIDHDDEGAFSGLIALPFYTILCDLLIASWWHETNMNWFQIIVFIVGLMLTLISVILFVIVLAMVAGEGIRHFKKQKTEHGLVVSWVKAKTSGACPKLEFEHPKSQTDNVIQI